MKLWILWGHHGSPGDVTLVSHFCSHFLTSLVLNPRRLFFCPLMSVTQFSIRFMRSVILVGSWALGLGWIRDCACASRGEPSLQVPILSAHSAPSTPTRDLLCSEAAQVIALANQGFALLEKAVGDRATRVQRLEVLAELVELRADVQEHEQNSPVRRVIAVVFHVALHLQRPHVRSWSWRDRGHCPSPPTITGLMPDRKHLNIPVMTDS